MTETSQQNKEKLMEHDFRLKAIEEKLDDQTVKINEIHQVLSPIRIYISKTQGVITFGGKVILIIAAVAGSVIAFLRYLKVS